MRVEEFMKLGGKEPKVGMPVTIHYYSDAEPAEVVKVSPSGKTIWIRKLRVQTSDGPKEMGHQDWEFKAGDFEKVWDEDTGERGLAKKPDNYTYFKATLRKDNCFRTSNSNLFLTIGVARRYYDWSF